MENKFRTNKRIRKIFRELASKAYERELTKHLTKLAEKFDDWRSNKIDSGQMSTLIHKYYRGPSKDMFSMYNSLDTDVLVIRAVVNGFITEDEIPDELLEYVKERVEVFKELH